jgi:hypothetical protein
MSTLLERRVSQLIAEGRYGHARRLLQDQRQDATARAMLSDLDASFPETRWDHFWRRANTVTIYALIGLAVFIGIVLLIGIIQFVQARAAL